MAEDIRADATHADAPPSPLQHLINSLSTDSSKAGINTAWSQLNDAATMTSLISSWRTDPDHTNSLLSIAEAIPGNARRARSLRSSLKRAASEQVSVATDRLIDDLETRIGGPMSLADAFGAGAPPPSLIDAAVLASLKTPRGYEMTPQGVFKLRAGHDGDLERVPVCAAPIFICGRALDVVSKEAKSQIIWRGPSGWTTRTVNRRTIMDTSRIISLADFDAPVSSTTISTTVAFLAEFETTNQHTIPVIQASTQMGWQSDGGFLLPDVYYAAGPVGDYRLVPPTGLESLTEGWRTQGTLEGWLKIVSAARHYPVAMLAIYASLSAPLIKFLDIPSFIVDISGETSGGKTTVLRLAASVWGRPSDAYPSAMYSWDSTQVWIERTAGFLHSLPLILDETKRARHPNIVRDVIYSFCHGQGRGRGNLEGTRTTSSWQSVLISSGEGMATSFSQDAGTRARVLSLTGKPFGEIADIGGMVAEQVRDGVMRHFGHFGRLFTHYLVSNRDNVDDIKAIHTALKNRFVAGANTAVGRRIAGHMATVALAARIAEHIGMPHATEDPIAALFDAQAQAASDADRPLIALQDVIGWCVMHQTRFYGRHEFDAASNPRVPYAGWMGAWSKAEHWRHIAVVATEMRDYLARQGYDPVEVLQRWQKRGWVDSKTWSTRIQGSVARCYRVQRSAIDLALIDETFEMQDQTHDLDAVEA